MKRVRWIAWWFLATPALAASPLSADDRQGLEHYCREMYGYHHYPAPRQTVYCQCFVEESALLHPTIRRMLIAIGTDPGMRANTQARLQQIVAGHSKEEQQWLVRQMQHFLVTVQTTCASTLE